MLITKTKDGKEINSYNIYNVDTIAEMGKIVDRQHNHKKSLACDVRWGGNDRLTLRYNDGVIITIN